MEACGHGFVVGDALRVGALDDADEFVGQGEFAFLYHFVVADDVQLDVGGYDGDAVYLVVGEEFVGYLDDAFLAQFLALEVEADGDVVAHVLQAEEGYYGEELFGGYVVDDGAVLQCGYL